MWKALRSPSGVQRGIRKHEIPESVWARTRKASHIGAEQNHLWPTISYSAPPPPPLIGVAVVVLARTSEPPCFSVIAIPQSDPRLPVGRHRALRRSRAIGSATPTPRPLGLGAHCRDHRVGHRDRAADAALGLHQEHERRPRATWAPGRVAPGRGVEPWSIPMRSVRARSCRTRPRRPGCRSGRGAQDRLLLVRPRSRGDRLPEPQIAPARGLGPRPTRRPPD